MSPRRLAVHARAHEVLTASEFERGLAPSFETLFAEQVRIVAESVDEPTIAELLASRRRAVALWKFDRMTSDADLVRDRSSMSRWQERAEEFAEAELRRRMGQLLLGEMLQVDTFLAAARGAEFEVEEFGGERAPLTVVGG